MQAAGTRLVKLVNRALRDADLPTATIENCLDAIDTIVNPTYTLPSIVEGTNSGRGSGKSMGNRGAASRKGRHTGFPQDGASTYSPQGGFPYATGGQMSLGGSPPPNLNGYGFQQGPSQHMQTAQTAPQTWRNPSPGPADRQPRCVLGRFQKNKVASNPTDQAQGPATPNPPQPLPSEEGLSGLPPLCPSQLPSSPEYEDTGIGEWRKVETKTPSQTRGFGHLFSQ